MELSTIKLSLGVKARMLARQEVLRDKALDTNIFDGDLITGLIEQNQKLRHQMYSLTRNAVVALFLAFVAWKGGNIAVPGTSSKIGEIPAFFEISLVVCAVQLSFIPFLFLSTQLYEGIISVLVESRSVDGLVDSDLVKASKEPIWLFVKYVQPQIITGRTELYEISKSGRIFNIIFIIPLIIVVLLAYILLNFSILYLAHVGLSNSVTHVVIYIICIFCLLTALVGALGNILEFSHTVRGDLILLDPKYQDHNEEPEDGKI